MSEVIRERVYRAALQLNRVQVRELAFFRRAQWESAGQVASIQAARLEALLAYARDHVPYYRDLFERDGLTDGGRLRPERFSELATLDKPTIRANFAALTTDEVDELHVSENRTGGSTGEPLVVLQGRDEVRVTGGAVTRLFYEMHGVRAGEREVKLWGSERDLFHGLRLSGNGIREWLGGVRTLNAFRMTPTRMREYLNTLNVFAPRVFRGYSSNLFELAKFAAEEGIAVRPPGLVISSAGTLYPLLRQTMSEVFGCGVFNHYGSREMHCMAMECPAAEGLHISALTHLIEVLDEDGRPSPPGVEGDIVVTALLNRAMPLIRYSIGDRGTLSQHTCSCGRGFPLLGNLTGRRADCFRTLEGKIIPGEYFIHFLAVQLKENPIFKFQVLQEEYGALRLRLALREGHSLSEFVRREIEEKTRLVMGEDCRLEFELVDDIPPSISGKYLYTLCSLPGAAEATVGNRSSATETGA